MRHTPAAPDIDALRAIAWPPDNILRRVAASPEPLGMQDFNFDPTEQVTPEQRDYAALSQDVLLTGLLRDGRQSFAKLAVKTAQGSTQRESLRTYDQMMAAYEKQQDPRRRAAILERGRELGLPLPVSGYDDGGYIGMAPFALGVGDSPALLEKFRTRNQDELSFRLYLNPPRHLVPDTVAEIAKQARGGDALFHLKFVDARDSSMDGRTDKVAVYVPESELGNVLEIIDRVEERMPEVFEGRRLPELAYPLRRGVGLAANTHGGASFTRRGVGVLNAAKVEVAGIYPGTDAEQQVLLLRSTIGRVAVSHGVDPVNIALPPRA